MKQDLARTILGYIGDGIVSVDTSLEVVFANPAACNLLGVDESAIIGMGVGDLMPLAIYDEECRRTPIDPFGIAISTGNTTTYSEPMVVESVNDRVLYVEDTVSPVKSSDGDVVGAVMVFRDVTDEMRMTAMLKMANHRYKELFDNIKSGVAVYESDDGEVFRIVDFNPAAEKIEGVSRADVVGKRVDEVFPGVVAIGLLDVFKRTWKTGAPEKVPCSLYEDAVRKGWRDNYVYRLHGGEIVAVYDDVTSKRGAAEKISGAIAKTKENETRLGGLFDNSSVGLVVANGHPDYMIVQANPTFCDFIGYSKEELVEKSIRDITHPDDWEDRINVESEVGTPTPPGKRISVFKRYMRKDGEVRWASVFLSKIQYPNGHVEYFAQIVDVTDKRRTEDEKKLLTGIVSILNASKVKTHDAIAEIMRSIKHFARLDAVAVRLPSRIGHGGILTDYPFYFQDGFDPDFVAAESSLICRGDDGECLLTKDGKGKLACLCGNVILGKPSCGKPFFTGSGSFWTNNLSEVSARLGDVDLEGHPRGTCWKVGYESVAIIPFMSDGAMVGAMLLNSKKPGVFDDRMVAFLEEVGKTMGVAFSRMQTASDVEESRNALSRANGILSVECDVARSMTVGSEGGLDGVLCKAGRKLRVRWMCVVVVGDGGIAGRWTDEGGSSVNSIEEVAKFDSRDVSEVRRWASTGEPYVGEREGMPACLAKMSKPVGGEWMAIPVSGDKPRGLLGVVLVSAKNGKKWSKDEKDAMGGLATMLCILANGEKNRNELARRIEKTITEMSEIIGSGTGVLEAEKC